MKPSKQLNNPLQYEISKSTKYFKYLGAHLSFKIGQAALRLAWEAIAAPDQVDHGDDDQVDHGDDGGLFL